MNKSAIIGFTLAVAGVLFFAQNGAGQVLQKGEKEGSPAGAEQIVKAVYLKSSAASRKSRIDYVLGLSKTSFVNAIVIDVKDSSGYIAYDTMIPEAIEYRSKRVIIQDIDSLLERLHKEGIYVIARIVVFQDPVLARARQDLAIFSKKGEGAVGFLQSLVAAISLWFDSSRTAWMDPAAKEVWDYNIKIAKEALELGFDEVNFDYVRFPSDGDLKNMNFPVWSGKTPKREVIRNFFQEVRKELPGAKLSVDVFGLTTYASSDAGIGQIIEDGFESFDYVSPMVYPSHYAAGFLSYKNPALYPYEIVRYSMENAQARLRSWRKLHETDKEKIEAKLRPWLQAFHMGAFYNPKKVQAQIQAVEDALGSEFAGFMLWNAGGWYVLN